jgi:hypothetical protein
MVIDESSSSSESFCAACLAPDLLYIIQQWDLILQSQLWWGVSRLKGSIQSGTLSYTFSEMSLEICIDMTQVFPVDARINNKSLRRIVVDDMRVRLREYLTIEQGAFREPRIHEIGLLILRIVEEVAGFVNQHNEERMANGEEVAIVYQPVLSDDMIVDTYEHPQDILGNSAKDIGVLVAPPGSRLRLVHCENIMRYDLKVRFRQQQEAMRRHLIERVSLHSLRQAVPREHQRGRSGVSEKYDLVDFLVRPQMTFHGTLKKRMHTVVRYGFIKPGDPLPWAKNDKSVLSVRCGSTYGAGIYSSPDPHYALCYSDYDALPTEPRDIPGKKLIVCATLMGRMHKFGGGEYWRKRTAVAPMADSHVSFSEMEYVVFNAAQILPLHVLHLDWGASPEKTMEEIRSRAFREYKAPKAVEDTLFPGDKQRLKEERLAQARKFFAYGYGRVPGNKIIVEDIAEVNDDEEDYGDYQANRVDIVDGPSNVWDWGSTRGQRHLDQYAKARFSNQVIDGEEKGNKDT